MEHDILHLIHDAPMLQGFLGALLAAAPLIGKGLGKIFGGGGGGAGWGGVLDAAGSAIGGMASGAAKNRGEQVGVEYGQEEMRQGQQGLDQRAMRDFYDTLMARERGERDSGKDALRSLQHAEYIKGGGRPYEAPTTASGFQLPAYGFGPSAKTETEQAGAAGLIKELMARLQGGYDVPRPEMPTPREPFTVPDEHRKAGAWEKIAGIAGSSRRAQRGLSPPPVVRAVEHHSFQAAAFQWGDEAYGRVTRAHRVVTSQGYATNAYHSTVCFPRRYCR